MHGTNQAARLLPIILLTLTLATLSAAFPGLLAAQNAAANQSAHLYFFTNPGCAPCRQVEPGIEALTKEGYPITTVFLNQQPDLARRFSVDRTPTVILVSKNKIVGRHAGMIDGVDSEAVVCRCRSQFRNGFSESKRAEPKSNWLTSVLPNVLPVANLRRKRLSALQRCIRALGSPAMKSSSGRWTPPCD